MRRVERPDLERLWKGDSWCSRHLCTFCVDSGLREYCDMPDVVSGPSPVCGFVDDAIRPLSLSAAEARVRPSSTRPLFASSTPAAVLAFVRTMKTKQRSGNFL